MNQTADRALAAVLAGTGAADVAAVHDHLRGSTNSVTRPSAATVA